MILKNIMDIKFPMDDNIIYIHFKPDEIKETFRRLL